MTRIKKILYIQKHTNHQIEYHYRKGENYSRLIIDEINGLPFLMTMASQQDAVRIIDKLYTEEVAKHD